MEISTCNEQKTSSSSFMLESNNNLCNKEGLVIDNPSNDYLLFFTEYVIVDAIDDANKPKKESSKDEIFRNQQLNFSGFIIKRKKYLDSLIDLSEDWISGESKIPNEKSIDISKKILDSILFLFTELEISVPQIIMSPIPSGGIGFTVIINNNNQITISIYNDSEIEIEYESNSYYDELENITEDNVCSEFETLFEALSSKYA